MVDNSNDSEDFWRGYDACKAKDMGDASTRKDEDARENAALSSPATPHKFQTIRDDLPRFKVIV